MSISNHVRIDLAPKAGFCVKTNTLAPGAIPLAPSPDATNPNLLEPATPNFIVVPQGMKVFVNIAWDAQVPPPPEGSEDAIQQAMQGEGIDERNPDGWYVPVIVSNGRQDTDKAGNPSLAFDCVYNTAMKSRTLRDPEFKVFLVELALQRIEAQTNLSLSRSIGAPNIASKGKLLPRTVYVPAATLTGPRSKSFDKANDDASSNQTSSLIQEVSSSSITSTSETLSAGSNVTRTHTISSKKESDTKGNTSPSSSLPASTSKSNSKKDTLPGLRGILKNSSNKPSSLLSPPTPSNSKNTHPISQKGPLVDNTRPLEWSWEKGDDSGLIRVNIEVPGLSLPLVQSSTLDIEPRRIILSIPSRLTLDVDLAISDAEIASRVRGRRSTSTSPSNSLPSIKQTKDEEEDEDQKRDIETTQTLQLKRQRDFDVEGARAEWKVGSGVVVIYV